MSIYFTLFLLAIGLLILVKGGDWFLDSTIWIGEITGVSFGIIGAILVSLATTLPEFFVSVISSSKGFSDMAVGNAIGSYICNIAFVIGIVAMIRPIKIDSDFFGLKGAMMFSYLSLFYFFAADGVVTYKDGKLLILLVVLFILLNFLEHRKYDVKARKLEGKSRNKENSFINIMKFVSGAILIVLGAQLLIKAGIELADFFRIPKIVISLTLLALGTSLPELVTGISATIKNKQSISVGNILGANIMNITLVLGVSALVSSEGLIITSQTINTDLPIAVLISLIFILSGIIFKKIGRITGALLLSIYIGYVYCLF